MTKPSVLILGGTGNLGKSLHRLTANSSDFEPHFPSRIELPLHNLSKVKEFLNDLNPSAIINAAAWTDVEGAEASQSDARYMNATLPKILSIWSSERDVKFIHFSTDYVFDGLKSEPYLESDKKTPISFYGLSKSEGEDGILASSNPHSIIVRTSGLYGFTPNNFVMKVLKKALDGQELNVVTDQVMTPTNADDLAAFSLTLLRDSHFPHLIHFSNTGTTNWNEISREIYRIVGKNPNLVKPISSNEYHSVAQRPKQSCLATLYPEFTSQMNHTWQDSLDRFLKEVLRA